MAYVVVVNHAWVHGDDLVLSPGFPNKEDVKSRGNTSGQIAKQ